ncbi:hypothetical protein F909_00630 [Acinetobacter sp. ANC 3929]|uniref:hypothetical protein n=1 Tax=unclassified Acinetobacter TaxID=196816 RepID=UPI0002CEE978|nr:MULTISPECIES: hypothetical protein [unclassified Acinetobacter]ENW83615.1 hypothetical protein F909_00630 [Acinetobacter sp. ANC 3929]MCH7350707.1 hypothetical protein [Acinetobacter sp. NIPH 2023]MCH7354731.1 hypothetical protein [Acinetobacter sp. NIPH 1958]MCH7358499.1 hypothetical protein [Acinetobacter sp. NIPH 2024]
MYKTLSFLLFTACFGLSGCATTLLDKAFPNETTQTQSVTLKQDQIIALGQAIQNQTEQGLVFIGQDFNYLMTDGSAELLKLLNTIPTEQRTLTSPSPLVLTMEDPNHFRGVLQIRYNTRMVDLNQKQKVLLKSLGFRQNFDLIQNQQTAPYPYINVFFKGQLYQGLDHKKIQQKLPQPYPILLQQQITTTTKHPVKRATHMVLYPLAMAFDVITVTPLLIWSDMRGDFNK